MRSDILAKFAKCPALKTIQSLTYLIVHFRILKAEKKQYRSDGRIKKPNFYW